MTNTLKFKVLNMSEATTARYNRYKAAPLYRAEVTQLNEMYEWNLPEGLAARKKGIEEKCLIWLRST